MTPHTSARIGAAFRDFVLGCKGLECALGWAELSVMFKFTEIEKKLKLKEKNVEGHIGRSRKAGVSRKAGRNCKVPTAHGG